VALAATIVAGSARADQRVIVLLHPPQARSQAATIDRNAPRIYAKWRVVPGFAATVDDAELQRLRNDPAVLSVEPDLGGSVTAVSSGESIGVNGELLGLAAVQALGYDGTADRAAQTATAGDTWPETHAFSVRLIIA
jgi:Peptidase inhibitor I9